MMRVAMALLSMALLVSAGRVQQEHVNCNEVPKFCARTCRKFEYCLTAPDDACDNAPDQCDQCSKFAACDKPKQKEVALHSHTRKTKTGSPPTEEDILMRKKLRDTYSLLLREAADVEVARRQVATLGTQGKTQELSGPAKRILKADPGMIAETAEKVAIQAREAAGQTPMSIAEAIPGTGPLATYRQASTELVDAARAVNFLRRKVEPVHPEMARAFVAKFTKGGPLVEAAILAARKKEGSDEEEEETEEQGEGEAMSEREELKEEVEDTKKDMKEAAEELDEATEVEEKTDKEAEESEELLADAEEDHEFKEEVKDKLYPKDGTLWSIEDEPFAAGAAGQANKAEEKHHMAKKTHKKNAKKDKKAKKQKKEAVVEKVQSEEDYKEAADDLHDHNEEEVETLKAKADAAEEALQDAEENQEEHEAAAGPAPAE